MNAVDSSVREFTIAFYPPTIFSTVFFCAALAVMIAAGVWLGMRFSLHRYGGKAEGTVTDSVLEIKRIKGSGFNASRNFYTRHLTISFTGPDEVKRIIKGTDYSNEEGERSGDSPRVGGKVPVLYSKTNPDNAMYYDPLWHYLMPAVSVAVGLFLLYMAVGFCYKDIRVANSLSVSSWTEEQYRGYQDAVIECNDQIYREPNHAAAYERRGDAQFAMVQYRDAIEDYSAALRLLPERRELLLKRAKAAWLDGRDYEALRDWWKSR